MGLFDRFSDTVFLKSDSELEKELEELKSIRDRVKDKEKIDQLNDFLNKEKSKKKWEDLDTEKNMRSLTEGWLEANIVRNRDYSTKYEFICTNNLDIPDTVNESIVKTSEENNASPLNDIQLFNAVDKKSLIENSLKEFRTKKARKKIYQLIMFLIMMN